MTGPALLHSRFVPVARIAGSTTRPAARLARCVGFDSQRRCRGLACTS